MRSINFEEDVFSATNSANLPAFQLSKDTSSISPTYSYILKEVKAELSYQAANVSDEYVYSEQEVSDIILKTAEKLGLEISNYERDEIQSYIEKELKPFGLLQDLVEDPKVSDIIVSDFSKIEIQEGRKNYLTGIRFANSDAYEVFVERILQKAGTSYSTKKPIADGMIGSFARIHAVHKSICETGPYLTVRLNRFSEVSIKDLCKFGSAPRSVFEYLTAMICGGATLLVAGEVGTGKTTLARALAASVPNYESILVIEDTPEIQLQHPHVRYIRTREENTDGAGRISPTECIRGGMRMAMNRIIFGEIRDAEAAEAFIDVCASGHPGLSTIHSRSAIEAVSRLELFLGRAQKGVSTSVLTEQISKAVNLIVHIDLCKLTGARRIMHVLEIGPVADGILRQREIFSYCVQGNSPKWKVVNKVSSHRESLEAHGVFLTKLPAFLDLDFEFQNSN
ncbi:MAG: CpaF family protein [Bdellovibrionales bacterium]|nr:CpaF family protein [Bdellovibrionales bacterium]